MKIWNRDGWADMISAIRKVVFKRWEMSVAGARVGTERYTTSIIVLSALIAKEFEFKL